MGLDTKGYGEGHGAVSRRMIKGRDGSQSRRDGDCEDNCAGIDIGGRTCRDAGRIVGSLGRHEHMLGGIVRFFGRGIQTRCDIRDFKHEVVDSVSRDKQAEDEGHPVDGIM